jgi:hypothetical protein
LVESSVVPLEDDVTVVVSAVPSGVEVGSVVVLGSLVGRCGDGVADDGAAEDGVEAFSGEGAAGFGRV